MTTKRTQNHEIVIKVRFDRKCSRAVAIRELRDTIHGTFYTSPREDREPESYKVRGFRHPVETI